MQRIALEAIELGDAPWAFHEYAREQGLTVNEVVYYLNAYEYGGVAGLEAIRNLDIIPLDVARGAIEAIGAALDAHFEWPLSYRLTDEGTGIGVYQIQERMNGDRFFGPHLPVPADLERADMALVLDAQVRRLVAIHAAGWAAPLHAQGAD
jgi:hypothetical protein